MDFVANILNSVLSVDVLKNSLLLYIIYRDVLKPNYVLHRGHLVNSPKKVMLPPQIVEKHKEMTDEEIYDSKLDERIILFKKVLRENLTKEQRVLFNNNLKNLDIKDTLKSKIAKKLKEKNIGLYKYLLGVGGRYVTANNTILIYNDAIEIVIYHELFHMASSVVKKDIVYSGLFQRNKKYLFGYGINEGVTQYLTEKYFSDTVDDKVLIYPFETHIVKCLNIILGESVVTNAYFSADLIKLINEMSKYTTREKALKFIEHLDIVNRFANKPSFALYKKRDTIQKSIDYINNLLEDMYLKKILDKNVYTHDELEKIYLSFVSFLYNCEFYQYSRYKPINYENEYSRGR